MSPDKDGIISTLRMVKQTQQEEITLLNQALVARDQRVADYTTKLLRAEGRIAELEQQLAKLNAMRTHCEDCGADYVATGVEAGCPCKLKARIAELERENAVKRAEIERMENHLEVSNQVKRFQKGHIDRLECDVRALTAERDTLRDRAERLERALRRLDCSPGLLPHPELDGYCAYCKGNKEIRDAALAPQEGEPHA